MTPSTLVMMMLMVIIVILLVVLIMNTYKTKEKFGDLQRRRVLSKSSLSNTARDETEEDLETEDESLNQAETKEGYVVTRNNMLFPGQFDHLHVGKKDKPSFRQSNKSIVQEIGDTVKEKVQAMTEQIAESNMTQDNTVSDLQNPETAAESVPEEASEYATEKVGSSDPEVLSKDDVISNSGKPIEGTAAESFGLTRINNDFSLFKTGTTASEIAQQYDPANDQKSIDMMSYIKKTIGAQ